MTTSHAPASITRLIARLPDLLPPLLAWYRRHHRPLPWRDTRDPYGIWLSEVMLQQTGVATVIPYFERFLARVPTVEALAKAKEEEVLKLWEGLGYYRRARNLIPAAKLVATWGAWPRDVEGLMRLPSVGRSTAGAIVSFAFRNPAPILDGNVRRVWWRLGALKLPDGTPGEKHLWSVSEAACLTKPDKVNQALMELGALVCAPRDPRCEMCPLSSACEAFRLGATAKFPPRRTKPPRKVVEVSVAVIMRGGRFLVTQRPSEGLLGGLWELPGGKWEAGETAEEALQREMSEELGIHVIVKASFPPLLHAYTHFTVRLHPFLCTLARSSRPKPPLPSRWISHEQVGELAFPTGTLKVFDRVFGVRMKRSRL